MFSPSAAPRWKIVISSLRRPPPGGAGGKFGNQRLGAPPPRRRRPPQNRGGKPKTERPHPAVPKQHASRNHGKAPDASPDVAPGVTYDGSSGPAENGAKTAY